jgi:serine/threonine-protein kinase
MKHVKEPMPDVQKTRPEVSSALAAVLDRATAKETANRYGSADELVADLEHVLGIEVARAGETHGEATAVLRALPGDTAEFVPARLRHPVRQALLVAAALLLIGAGVYYFAGRTEKGPGSAAAPRAGGLAAVNLASSAAHDFDPPPGDQREHPDSTLNAIDGNPSTVWDTETYQGGLQGAGKAGVGLYIDAGSPIVAKQLDVVTQTPGFVAAVYAANGGPPKTLDGWTKVSADTDVKQDQKIPLHTRGRQYRYYLLWITKLDSKVAIAELTLRR